MKRQFETNQINDLIDAISLGLSNMRIYDF